MHASTSFADRIVNITVAGTTVRIEPGTLALPAADGTAPKLAPSQTLVMPLDGLRASFGIMEGVPARRTKS
jgi:hypothetical protein